MLAFQEHPDQPTSNSNDIIDDNRAKTWDESTHTAFHNNMNKEKNKQSPLRQKLRATLYLFFKFVFFCFQGWKKWNPKYLFGNILLWIRSRATIWVVLKTHLIVGLLQVENMDILKLHKRFYLVIVSFNILRKRTSHNVFRIFWMNVRRRFIVHITQQWAYQPGLRNEASLVEITVIIPELRLSFQQYFWHCGLPLLSFYPIYFNSHLRIVEQFIYTIPI
jgi:hypothetical protein